MDARRIWNRASHASTAVAMSVVLVTVALATPAGAVAATITVAPAAVTAGATVTFTGSIPTTGDPSCPAASGVTLISTTALFPQGGFGPTAPRDANGAFTITYVVPASTATGTYDVGMRCGGGLVGVSAALQVTGVAPRAVPGEPSLTG